MTAPTPIWDIREVIGRDIPPIKVVDVGAMSLGDDTEAYAPLLKEGLATVIGFEPLKQECEKLQSSMSPTHQYLPYAIGDGSKRTLHIAASSMTSSLYEPNLDLVEKFQNLAELMYVVRKEPVQTHRLDDLSEVKDADYLKLDVQGAELDVIRGAQRLLNDVVVVHTEVEYVPLYKNQPLFAEVDQALRQSGFLLHRILGFGGRVFYPLVVADDLNQPGSQHLWSDAVYVKDFTRLAELSAEKLLKLAVILHTVYQSLDFVNFVLETYDLKMKTGFSPVYLNRLVPQPSQKLNPGL